MLYQLQDAEYMGALELALDLPEDYYVRLEELASWPLVVAEHPALPIRWY